MSDNKWHTENIGTKDAKGTMVMHCGGRFVSREELDTIHPTQEATRSHCPVPHRVMVNNMERGLDRAGLAVKDAKFAVHGKDDSALFALWHMTDLGGDDWSAVVGFRHSNDKRFSAACLAGDNVFVCDNTAISASIVTFRKHTTNILADMPDVINRGLAQVNEFALARGKQIDRMKEVEVNDEKFHDLLIKAAEGGAIGRSDMWKVLGEWREPSFDAFKDRTAWSAFNAFTCPDVQGGDLFAERAGRIATNNMRLSGLFIREFRPLAEVSRAADLEAAFTN